ncbi:FxsA family protein [Hydrocarboniclastica marina]|uniref:FxsA family protein n=1 Tax=Hydrocarboniclastica marina TaxID=2259620 RepID=A0A4P7XJ94_9ALTE|nr:FxsA family protein [Hydrocarboniclastica marina]QCF26422.1 FxsA family protein [Hydrocarboniclastica marina]
MRFLLLPFVVFPIVEMVVLIKVGSAIGVLPTVGLVLLTAVIGAALLRVQGLATLLRANQRMQSGEIPAQEVAEGFVLAIGGALLLTPGFVTDAMGLCCLLPGSRRWLISRLMKRFTVSGQASAFTAGFGARPAPGGRVIIEGEFDREQNTSQSQRDIEGRQIDRSPGDGEKK